MSTPEQIEGRAVRCPNCGGTCLFARGNPWRPFCSERCRNHDLGAWASEAYRVAVRPSAEIDEVAAGGALPH